MQHLYILDWILEIDREKTITFYKNLPTMAEPEQCGCLYCRNYVQACQYYPKEVLGLFNLLGIDPQKEAEVFEIDQNENGTHTYSGFYHLVGRIVKGEDCHKKEGGVYVFPFFERFHIGFTADVSLVAKDFPHPILQMEFETDIPWVLDEKPN